MESVELHTVVGGKECVALGRGILSFVPLDGECIERDCPRRDMNMHAASRNDQRPDAATTEILAVADKAVLAHPHGVARTSYHTPHAKATGIWGRNVQSDNKKTNAVKFWNISEQAMFNLSNMFCGYSDTRVWNFIPYAGAGVLRNMSHNYYAMTVSAGIVNTWKLSKHFLLNLDLGYTFAPDYDAFRPATGAVAANYGDGMKNCDRFFTAEIGLTYNLGKTGWNKTPDVEAIKALSQGQIDALNAQLSDAQAENARLKNMLANLV